MLNHNSSVPLYQQISSYIKKQIIDDIYSDGMKIPTEIELMEKFNVSRTTVRLAMKEIIEEDLVVKKAGKGTFVKKNKIYHNLEGFKSLYETLLEANIIPETEILQFSKEAPSEKLKGIFKLTGGKPLLKIIRIYHIDNEPIAYAQIHVHPRLSESITKMEAIHNPIYKLIEKNDDIKIKQANFEIFAANASKDICTALSIQENDAVLGAERVFYTDSGEPVEHTILLFRSDAYRFTLALQGGTKIEITDLNHFNWTIKNSKNYL